jgi:hypothetical protein
MQIQPKSSRRKVISRISLSCAVLALVMAVLSESQALATAAPAAATGPAQQVQFASATVSGTVNPSGAATSYFFEYGSTSAYGMQTSPASAGSGTANVPVEQMLSGLAASTTYHYRLVATNSTSTSLGSDRTLTTSKIPLSLAITAAPDPVGFGAAVTIEGTLSGTGNGGAVVQLQQTAFPYTAGFVDIGNPELTLSNGTFAFNVLSLAQNTQYRVVSGNVASSDVVVSVSVAVALNARATGTRRHPTIRFSGTISPAEPSARIAYERLVGTSWKVVGGAVASGSVVNGSVTFASTVHVHQGGFFRALVLPTEGSHVSGYSQTVVIRLK